VLINNNTVTSGIKAFDPFSSYSFSLVYMRTRSTMAEEAQDGFRDKEGYVGDPRLYGYLGCKNGQDYGNDHSFRQVEAERAFLSDLRGRDCSS
jgi:hypothetical protein